MAIEIRELVIKTTVNEAQHELSGGKIADAGKEEIIQECIDKVVEMLKYDKER